MAAKARSPPPMDELDRLFNYDQGMDDVFKDAEEQVGDAETTQSSKNALAAPNGGNLGIDEEITIVKKRQPIPKLDENRLLSAAGIPKLRRISKERLRFKGKGHEYSNVARLLNMYQLWLDDLYPRAKFADALTIIEKEGHKKRMQMMRKEWINESKPRPYQDEVEDEQNADPAPEMMRLEGAAAENGSAEEPPRQNSDEGEDSERSGAERGHATSSDHLVDEPEEDELDALLRENPDLGTASMQRQTLKSRPSPAKVVGKTVDDDYAAELEVMNEMEDMW